jgi:phage terminase small subunit
VRSTPKAGPGAKPSARVKAGTSRSAALARREAFAQAYIGNGRNGTQAAITAGYSPKTATVQAAQLLTDPNVRALINEAMEKHSKAAGLTVERVLEEVRRLSLADTRRLYREDGTLKRPDEWDDETAAAVAGLEVIEEFSGAGEARELSGHTKKIKLWDKNAALEKAMKHLGLYERDNAQRGESLAIQINLVGPR